LRGFRSARLQFTDWAKDILRRADVAARRFNPDVRIRLARVGGVVQATFTDEPAADDLAVALDGGVTVYAEAGLEGLVDVEEPHDRIVLKPAGAPWNDRSGHDGS
jgi:hypothetical protein